eukprot:6184079-Pleurochrysis_carterae.AAC.2
MRQRLPARLPVPLPEQQGGRIYRSQSVRSVGRSTVMHGLYPIDPARRLLRSISSSMVGCIKLKANMASARRQPESLTTSANSAHTWRLPSARRSSLLPDGSSGSACNRRTEAPYAEPRSRDNAASRSGLRSRALDA